MSQNKYFVTGMPRRKFLKDSLKGGAVITAAPSLLMNMLSCKQVSQLPDAGVGQAELNRAIRNALERGGDFADIYIESRITRTISMEESKFKSAEYGISQGAGVRVISGDQTGYAYVENITGENLLKAADTASYIARHGVKTRPVDIERQTRPSYISVDIPLGEADDAERLEIMRRADQAALDYDSRITMTQISYYDEVRERIIANSEGLWVEDRLPLMFFIVQTLAVQNSSRHMGRERLSKHMGFEMFDVYSPEDVALRAAGESVAMLDAQDCP
ncbi:MAG: PmbA/TldA family metallopeptidase, partial [Candidatus Aminicenantaceae bacterium]